MLTEIQLKQHSTLGTLTLPLRPLTLITGYNGLGKTEILDAVHQTTKDSKLLGLRVRPQINHDPNLDKIWYLIQAVQKHYEIFTLELPELGLDAPSQDALGGLICRLINRGKQIIIETHSDFLFNSVRIAVLNEIIKPEDVLFLHIEREVGVADVYRLGIDKRGRIDGWPETFFSFWDRQLEELLRDRGER